MLLGLYWKVTRGRAGIRWDNVVDKIWKGLGGDQEEGTLHRKVWGVQDRNIRINSSKGKALALRKKVNDEGHLEIYRG